MEYTLIQKADKDLIYYGVYYTSVDLADEGDVLCAVRKKFFETGLRQKNRSTFHISGDMIRVSYTLESGKPLKWKKLIGNRQTERVTMGDSCYIVESLDSDRRVYRRSFYDLNHLWLSTEYFLSGDKNTPDCTLIPSEEGDKAAIIIKNNSKSLTMLFPFETSLDKELTERLNAAAGEPPVLCKTNCGTFYFCTEEEAKCREEILKRLLLENEEPENEDELIEPGFEINVSALSVDQPDDTPAVIPTVFHEIIPGLPESAEPAPPPLPVDHTQPEAIIEEETDDAQPVAEATDAPAPAEPSAPAAEAFSKQEAPVTPIISIAPHIRENDDVKNDEKPVIPHQPVNRDTVPVIHDFSFGTDSSRLYEESSTGEEAGFSEEDGAVCAFAGQCPYENIDKLIIESGGRQYFYFGDTDGDSRHGSGRTAMFDGKTAYEGTYRNDKRDGFGVYYFKSGKLCYAGSWKNNKRDGLGCAFSSGDGSMFVGKWQENRPASVGASFDRDGRLIYVGKTLDGKRNGTGITYSEEDDLFFIGKYQDGEFLGKGTQFDSDGNMLYTGGFADGMRCGEGVSYYSDGSVQYKGSWLNNLYDGKGTLYLTDGCVLEGAFRAGQAHGDCTLFDRHGRIIYQGGFDDDLYNGSGKLYYPKGNYIEGFFAGGEASGIVEEYNADGNLIYRGEWNDMERNGKGVEYRDGKKHYEGDFAKGRYHGQGKLYEDDNLIFSGSFRCGSAEGFGTELDKGTVVYMGMWKDNAYDGCGVLYEDGIPKYAGCFHSGSREGRINELQNNRIIRKCLYENDKLIYMCEYDDNGSILYYGNVKDGQHSGMGCSFNESGEKVFEGIFKNGRPEKAMSVFYKELEELPACSELEGTDYDSFIHAPDYAVELPYSGGIYTGQVKQDKPDGQGTILYFDHRYTGMFKDGEPNGHGVIYTRDGSEIAGNFLPVPAENCETMIFTNLTYYHMND